MLPAMHFLRDTYTTLMQWNPRSAWARLVVEVGCFGVRQTISCAFAGAFFAILALSKVLPPVGIPRYDLILIAALALQAAMVWSGLETRDELRTICLFHVLGFVLEAFKSNPAIGSWSYPEPGYTKLFGTPLYSGFMHAAVASYMIQSWRWLDLELVGAPPPRRTAILAALIYLNFFTHHWLPDFRYVLAVVLLWNYRHCMVHYTPQCTRRRMPMLLAFVLIGFFVWIAENIATYFGAWTYPYQQAGWTPVHAGKIGSWGLLVVITFVIVSDLKHYKRLRAERAAATSADATTCALPEDARA